MISSASVVCVGTELLLGNIVNTNAQYIAARLSALGVPLYHEFTVGDNPARLRETFARALSDSSLVIATGGLGPTRDDLTKETVCDLLGVKLVRSEEAEENIRLRLRGRVLTENNLKQADLPEGALPFHNSCGTAPGFALTVGEKTVIALPGVPHEMKAMFEEHVLPFIAARSEGIILSRNLHVCGLGESRIDALLGDIADGSNPTVAPYCKCGETTLRLSARAADEGTAREMLDAVEARIRQSPVGGHIYYVTETDGDSAVAAPLATVARLTREGKTLALAESITGGLIAKKLTDIPGVSKVFRGSAVVYATESKSSVLGVSEESISRYGVVSEQVAAEMAQGARERFGADVAAAVTGIASSSPDYPGERSPSGELIPPGTVCAAIAEETGVRTFTFRFGTRHTREYVRELTAGRIFHLLSGYKGDFS